MTRIGITPDPERADALAQLMEDAERRAAEEAHARARDQWQTAPPEDPYAEPRTASNGHRPTPPESDPQEPPDSGPGDAIAEIFDAAAGLDLWEISDELRLIRDHAHHRLVAPAALLGEVLIRVIAAVPPGVCLPPITGGRVSLNLFVGLVGESGTGKGGTVAAADDLVTVTGGLEPVTLPVGTGEGLVKTFRWPGRDGQVDESRSARSAIFAADEISTLARLGERAGSTLESVVKTAFMGAALGFTNAKAEARTHVPALTYRLCMSIGVQPALSEVLFRDTAGGTPQRWLFVPLADPDVPDADVPAPARLIEVNVGHWGEDERDNIVVPDRIRAAVRERRRAVLRTGHADPLASHRILSWLKVAVGVALLHGRPDIADTDLLVAARLILGSDRAIESMRAAVAREARQRTDAEHARQAAGAVKVEAALADHRRGRIGNRILDLLRAEDGSLRKRQLLQRWRSTDRAEAEAVLDDLAGQGLVTVTESGNRVVTVALVTR